MSHHLRKSRLAILQCVLYEFLRYPPSRKSRIHGFSNFKRVMGADTMSYREFKGWYERFEAGNFDLNETVSPLEDPTVIKSFILKDALQKVPVFEGFRNLSKLVHFDYQEYELWYFRFAQARYNFNYDRSEEMKKPELEDLPMDVIKTILSNLKFNERFRLRSVSRTFRDLVEGLKIKFKNVELDSIGNEISVMMSGGPQMVNLRYARQNEGCSVISKTGSRLLKDDDFVDVASKGIGALLRCTTLSFNSISLSLGFKEGSEELLRTLGSFGSVFQSKKILVEAREPSWAKSVLSLMQPQNLKTIQIKRFVYNVLAPLDKTILPMEMFLHADSINIRKLGFFSSRRLCDFSSSKKFELTVQKLTPYALLRLRDSLSNNFEFCRIQISENLDVKKMAKALGASTVRGRLIEFRHRWNRRSGDSLIFRVKLNSVRIQKEAPTLPNLDSVQWSDDSSAEESDFEFEF